MSDSSEEPLILRIANPPGREFQLRWEEANFQGKQLYIHEEPFSGLGTGGTVWDCGAVLVKYLEHGKLTSINDLVGKNVLELGSGTGLVGFGLALCGVNVMLTDASELLPLLSTNYELNKKNIQNTVLGIKELDWSNPANIEAFVKAEQESGRVYHYIVLADAIFHIRAILPLVTTLKQVVTNLSAPSGTIILMAHKNRNEELDEAMFDAFIDHGFKCLEEMYEEDQHPEFASRRIAIYYIQEKNKT